MSLAVKLKKVKQPAKRKEPIWTGPCGEGSNGGITFSMLSRWLVCRERARLRFIEGLKPADEFNHRTEFGSMWHLLEEAHAADKSEQERNRLLTDYCRELCLKYKTQQSQVEHWYWVCRTQFPVYVNFWRKHPDVKQRTPLLQEAVFDVHYELPSGRVVRLRGKWDSVDLIGKGKTAGVYLQENKSKGDIDEPALLRQLQSGYDLQTGIYITALQIEKAKITGIPAALNNYPIRGVRYNVVRRPLAGGKHSIKQHQPSKSNPTGETAAEFYNRLGGLIAEEPQHYFMRWKVEITPADTERFKQHCLNPILEQLCDWYGFITRCPDEAKVFGTFVSKRTDVGGPNDCVHYNVCPHFILPYGLYNPLLEGRATDIDEFLITGSTQGLQRDAELFGELK